MSAPATAAMLAVVTAAPFAAGQRPLEALLANAPPRSSFDWLWAAGVGWSALLVLVHIAFAIGVWRHARRARPLFVPAPWWGLATLLGGPFTAAAYWLMHLSTLAPARPPAESARPAPTRSAAGPAPTPPRES